MPGGFAGRATLGFAAVALFNVVLAATVAGATFTYQGRLTTADGAAASGSLELRFSLYDALTDGNPAGAMLTNSVTLSSNGLLTVALDFGAGAFDGSARWLELAVRSGTNGFAVLTPRQPVTAVPYALTAFNLSGAVQLTNAGNVVAGDFYGNGAGLTNLDTSAVTAWVQAQGYQTTNGVTRRALAAPVPTEGTNFIADFLNEVVQITATNHIYFLQSTNRPGAGWYSESVWYIQGGVTNYTLGFNSNWVSLGTLAASPPCLLASNKLTVVALSVRGAAETNVTYAIARQE
jgi:hypothetical protein